MSGAETLALAEVRLIKAMLRLIPPPSKQAVLSYFTRPGRDINHRLIAEIADGWRWDGVPPASAADTLAFMADAATVPCPDPQEYGGAPEDEAGKELMARPVGTLSLDWWPVGQGLFSTGAVLLHSGRSIHWVYDCGSSSTASLLYEAVGAYRGRLRKWGASEVTLVTLSHFDKDHISGIVDLMRGLPVRTLLLPYVPLWQRLVIALEQGLTSADPLLGFFEDPAGYLEEQEGIEIGEIIFAQAAGPDEPVPPAPDAGGGAPDEGPGDIGDELKIEEGAPPPEAAEDPAARDHPAITVRFLRKAGRLAVPAFWEFIPYNDAQPLVLATPSFQSRAAVATRIFLADPANRTRALRTLKKVYDHHFGSSSTARNLISLYLYSGAVGQRVSLRNPVATDRVEFGPRPDAFAQLHTGDAYLDTEQRLDAIACFLAADARFERAGIFQVMHHGARGNWHDGTAAALRPAVSIFCSDPAHKGFRHPHAEVLRDFWEFCPVQVGRRRGFHLFGLLEFD